MTTLQSFFPIHFDGHGLNSPCGERLLNFSKNPQGEYLLSFEQRKQIAAFVAGACKPPPVKYQTIPLSEIRSRYNPGKGRHFFDRSSMRFFRSKMPRSGYSGPGGVFFVTSEQFVGSDGRANPRRFTVRQLIESEDSDIKTVGEFNKLDRDAAVMLAKMYAVNGTPKPAACVEGKDGITCAHCGTGIFFSRQEVYKSGPSYVCQEHAGL